MLPIQCFQVSHILSRPPIWHFKKTLEVYGKAFQLRIFEFLWNVNYRRSNSWTINGLHSRSTKIIAFPNRLRNLAHHSKALPITLQLSFSRARKKSFEILNAKYNEVQYDEYNYRPFRLSRHSILFVWLRGLHLISKPKVVSICKNDDRVTFEDDYCPTVVVVISQQSRLSCCRRRRRRRRRRHK